MSFSTDDGQDHVTNSPGASETRSQDLAKRVKDFYERVPYPPPLTSLDEHRDLYQDHNRQRFRFHLLWPTESFDDKQSVLVAGCGTSQAARYALSQPGSQVTAIDISDVSLQHTRELQRKYDLKNLEIQQLALEEVGELGRTFDQIVCTGVLHHLPEPDEGLRALRDVLNPQGAMNLMVYAPYGRNGIYMMQEYCRLLGLEPSEDDLSKLIDTLRALPETHPIAHAMRQGIDFSHPDAVADALLHPLDRAYSVPQLFDWLTRCEMSFGRWIEQAPYLPHCGLVARTPLAARLKSLPDKSQYAAVELLRGVMVRHKFIAYRNDHTGDPQPIRFDGDLWRHYIPIRAPWTICVRERLPPGSVGVLINRAHSFTDLILTIDSFDDNLLHAIDGRRTIAEILEHTNVRDELRACGFFQRLWQYDQVVFDATKAPGYSQARTKTN